MTTFGGALVAAESALEDVTPAPLEYSAPAAVTPQSSCSAVEAFALHVVESPLSCAKLVLLVDDAVGSGMSK